MERTWKEDLRSDLSLISEDLKSQASIYLSRKVKKIVVQVIEGKFNYAVENDFHIGGILFRQVSEVLEEEKNVFKNSFSIQLPDQRERVAIFKQTLTLWT